MVAGAYKSLGLLDASSLADSKRSAIRLFDPTVNVTEMARLSSAQLAEKFDAPMAEVQKAMYFGMQGQFVFFPQN